MKNNDRSVRSPYYFRNFFNSFISILFKQLSLLKRLVQIYFTLCSALLALEEGLYIQPMGLRNTLFMFAVTVLLEYALIKSLWKGIDWYVLCPSLRQETWKMRGRKTTTMLTLQVQLCHSWGAVDLVPLKVQFSRFVFNVLIDISLTKF